MQTKTKVEQWVERFRAVGLDDDAMQRWHRLFEEQDPAGHQSFLEWLELPAERIAEVRGTFR